MPTSNKTPEMQAAVNALGDALFGRGLTDALKNHTCVTCGGDALTFKDDLSVQEYAISGMCQKCQDEVWSTPSE